MHPASPDPEPPPTADALAQPRAGACRVPVRGWGGSRALRACLAGPCLLMVTLLITFFRSKPFIIVRAHDRANLKYPSMEGSGGRSAESGNETTASNWGDSRPAAAASRDRRRPARAQLRLTRHHLPHFHIACQEKRGRSRPAAASVQGVSTEEEGEECGKPTEDGARLLRLGPRVCAESIRLIVRKPRNLHLHRLEERLG